MRPPRVSLVTAVYAPPRRAFEDTVDSVLSQTCEDWEWVVTDDGSPADWVVPRLRELAAADPRVKVAVRAENGGIVAASNDSLDRATGEFVVLLDHDDVLEPHALATMLAAVDADERPDEVDYAYSDQARMTDDGRRKKPFRKPEWSPERLRHHMYTLHLSMLRRSRVVEVGGFRPGYDGSQDHDLVLRVTERGGRVLHVPEVLYYWREVPGSAAADPEAKPYASVAGVRAVQDHLDRLGIAATVEHGPRPWLYRVRREPDLTTPVSVIVPTRGSRAEVGGRSRVLVVEAIRSVLASSRHRAIEVVVVYDRETPDEVLAELASIPEVRLVAFTEPFSFSAKINVGALHATGEVLVLLNDDTEAVSDGLVETLIAPLREPGVGVTGAKLLFEDGRIQHAGIIYGSGTLHHHYFKADGDALGSRGELQINREVSAVTAACLAVRREVFDEVGGLTELLPGNFNDVDFCLKVRRHGLRCLWLHDVVLHHFESATRDPRVHGFERRLIKQRWGDYKVIPEPYQIR
ncbi:glycosyltransferase family 2 protein [Nocardioides nitrophenolicus]|uniref:glycosyltransferase family 2 protein n=1 Tax=Nocardioides nitrophenolicus TaxID=60489 RepID=UPI00195D884E|nr:glycosyltransferase [Nocardioides nitrophenolicus]MBM7519554.1 GT2 family glycosyltransferase [Nocardioides nitrophenolicus]